MNTVTICGIDYAVEFVDEKPYVDGKPVDGCVDHRTATIRVWNKLSPQVGFVILWHEVLHVLFDLNNLQLLEQDDMLYALAHQLWAVLRGNEQLRSLGDFYVWWTTTEREKGDE